MHGQPHIRKNRIQFCPFKVKIIWQKIKKENLFTAKGANKQITELNCKLNLASHKIMKTGALNKSGRPDTSCARVCYVGR